MQTESQLNPSRGSIIYCNIAIGNRTTVDSFSVLNFHVPICYAARQTESQFTDTRVGLLTWNIPNDSYILINYLTTYSNIAIGNRTTVDSFSVLNFHVPIYNYKRNEIWHTGSRNGDSMHLEAGI
ncbi:hypothetical protein AVEN_44487-1 [Araneus ventricosus]|uniref:Uncharacterized protein n=1 Tax=Araneus ventricosus TaxID=182803 RepID=A0A4Y2UUY7_ARAVE|nr:hypothetical protein AVEN_44487-1 [Araneus ventricosus]